MGEESAAVLILTEDLGLLYGRAQGLRRPGAKLASALASFAESELILVRGRDGWRIAGATLVESWFKALSRPARVRAGRVAGLLGRLVPGEAADAELLPTMRAFFAALATLPESEHDAAECLAALRVLSTLGLDAGEIPQGNFGTEVLASIARDRRTFIARINRGIEASGL